MFFLCDKMEPLIASNFEICKKEESRRKVESEKIFSFLVSKCKELFFSNSVNVYQWFALLSFGT